MVTKNRHVQSTEYVSPTCPPGWAWLLAGILIGIFLSFLFYLREIAPQSLSPENALSPSAENVSVNGQSEQDDFVLFDGSEDSQAKNSTPESNSKPNDSKKSQAEEDLLPDSNLPVTAPGRYLLQVGSFRNESEAEGLKTYLNSLGMSADVKATALTEKGRWYRVQIGPFTNLDELNQTRSLLAANNIPALLRKF